MLALDVPDLAGTEALGRALGRELQPGTVVALIGDLGAGKTHLTRAIAEGLGIRNPDAVNSPTFVLIQEYDGPTPLYHFDAYRLTGDREFQELGSDEYFDGRGVCVVEWADRVPASLPPDRIVIRLQATTATARSVELSATGVRSAAMLARFAANLPQVLAVSSRSVSDPL
jgi:tRNA threonylcarbamoyladenosine biosynthesis protein TsaE